MSWLDKIPQKIKRVIDKSITHKSVPEGLWSKCLACQAVLYAQELAAHGQVCPQCGHHHRMSAQERMAYLLDEGKSISIGAQIKSVDVLKFKDSKRYTERLKEATQASHADEALQVSQGTIHHIPVILAVFEFKFMGGSMGAVVGERFVRGVEAAIEQQCGLVCVSASGGARMQEGLFSLMQMAKTSAALARLSAKHLPFISVLTDPTMGGVSASFAMLGDIIIAEPHALIGFAGPRVIEQTVRETLPEGFQRAEFLLAHGAIDMIVERGQLKACLARLLANMLHLPPPSLA